MILKLVTLAKERNIDYTPTMDDQTTLYAYCLRKNIPPPIANPGGAAPMYAPMPAPLDMGVNPDMPPGVNPDMPPGGHGSG